MLNTFFESKNKQISFEIENWEKIAKIKKQLKKLLAII